MGVTGCGKSTVANAWANVIDAQYIEGDDCHPAVNVEKMSRGEPLDDTDRWPWLETFARAMESKPGFVVGSCSALRYDYRRLIERTAGEPVLFIHLEGSRELIAGRLASRRGHFMPAGLLDSQFAALESIQADELAIVVDIDQNCDAIIASLASEMQSKFS